MSAHQIETLDLHFLEKPQLIASYLIRSQDAVILVESGPGSTTKALTQALAQHALKPADVTHVLLTHIHLDHAGAAGWLAQQGAQIYVHHIGAPHLIDPSRLWSSATRIYGEQMMDFLWGEMLPIHPDQVTPLHDKDSLNIGALTFVAHDTPGHAIHHMSYQLDHEVFTGDVAGTCVPGKTHIRIPSPPPEFEPDRWLQSIRRLRELQPQRLYLTHFGAFEKGLDFLDRVEQNLHALVAFIRPRWENHDTPESILDAYTEWIVAKASAEGADEDDMQNYEFMVASHAAVNGVLRYLNTSQKQT